jgi:hypothetical protein
MTSPFIPTGNFGRSLFGLDPYGSEFGSFGVVGAVAYTNTTVQIQFSDIINLSDLDFTDPANYSISPPLTVMAATIESADSVVLITEPTQLVEYTVTVSAGLSHAGVPLDPRYKTATFEGLPQLPTYFSCGTAATRVRIIFDTAVDPSTALVSTNYTVSDFNGNALPILSVQSEQAGGMVLVRTVSVVLTLGVPMVTTQWYQTTVSSNVKSTEGYSFSPATWDFQWVLPVATTSVPIKEFSGEVSGSPFGDPAGLVYFSPSLNVATPDSIIEVEEVACCTTAYDRYCFPQPVDPSPFYVWSPTTPTVLGQAGVVLWGGFPRLGDASFDLEFTGTHLVEPMPEALDNCCSVYLKAGFDPSYVSLLNDPAWWMFDETHSTTPPMFICANNTSGPIPPGGETTIILHCAIVGGSSFTAASGPQTHAVRASIEGGATFTTDIQGATSLEATSWVRIARASQNHSAVAAITGTSTLTTPDQPPHLWTALTISGSSEVSAVAT